MGSMNYELWQGIQLRTQRALKIYIQRRQGNAGASIFFVIESCSARELVAPTPTSERDTTEIPPGVLYQGSTGYRSLGRKM